MIKFWLLCWVIEVCAGLVGPASRSRALGIRKIRSDRQQPPLDQRSSNLWQRRQQTPSCTTLQLGEDSVGSVLPLQEVPDQVSSTVNDVASSLLQPIYASDLPREPIITGYQKFLQISYKGISKIVKPVVNTVGDALQRLTKATQLAMDKEAVGYGKGITKLTSWATPSKGPKVDFPEAKQTLADNAKSYEIFIRKVAGQVDATPDLDNLKAELTREATVYQKSITVLANSIPEPVRIDWGDPQPALESAARAYRTTVRSVIDAIPSSETDVAAIRTDFATNTKFYQRAINKLASWFSVDEAAAKAAVQEDASRYQRFVSKIASGIAKIRSVPKLELPKPDLQLPKAAKDVNLNDLSADIVAASKSGASDIAAAYKRGLVAISDALSQQSKSVGIADVRQAVERTAVKSSKALSTVSTDAVVPSSMRDAHSVEKATTAASSAVSTAVSSMDQDFTMDPSSNLDVTMSAASWSLTIMVSIVALLYLWDLAVEYMRTSLPATIQPVVERSLGEVAGLGFVGLVLKTVTFYLQPQLQMWSQMYFGSPDVLYETFEFVHTAFFQVGVAFFGTAGLLVMNCVKQLDLIENLNGIGLDDNGACTATTKGLADVLKADKLIGSRDGMYWDDTKALRVIKRRNAKSELTRSNMELGAEVLLIRDYLIRAKKLGQDVRMRPLIESTFTDTLYRLVELSPLTWIPLIPALALANSVDLSHGVINAASPNAATTAGLFLTSPGALLPSLVVSALSLFWSLWNFWKLSEIKSMLMPTLARDEGLAEVRLLPPRYMTQELFEQFSSTPLWMQTFEGMLGGRSISIQDELFGAAGSRGPELYLSSIRYHTWLCITSIVFFGSQIVTRDLTALTNHLEVGDPSVVMMELYTYGALVASSVGQLLLAPKTFFNYCLISTLEADEEVRPSSPSQERSLAGFATDQPRPARPESDFRDAFAK